MADIEVFIMHPTTRQKTQAVVDDEMTGQEILDDLIDERFIERGETGYELDLKGVGPIDLDRALHVVGVRKGDVLRVLVDPSGGMQGWALS